MFRSFHDKRSFQSQTSKLRVFLIFVINFFKWLKIKKSSRGLNSVTNFWTKMNNLQVFSKWQSLVNYTILRQARTFYHQKSLNSRVKNIFSHLKSVKNRKKSLGSCKWTNSTKIISIVHWRREKSETHLKMQLIIRMGHATSRNCMSIGEVQC